MSGIDPPKVRAARERAGLRREAVAIALGKSYHTIQAYENGQATPPGDVLVALAQIYGVTVERPVPPTASRRVPCERAPARSATTARSPARRAAARSPAAGRQPRDRGPAVRACGHVFEATWPGFTFEPETVIINPSGDGGE